MSIPFFFCLFRCRSHDIYVFIYMPCLFWTFVIMVSYRFRSPVALSDIWLLTIPSLPYSENFIRLINRCLPLVAHFVINTTFSICCKDHFSSPVTMNMTHKVWRQTSSALTWIDFISFFQRFFIQSRLSSSRAWLLEYVTINITKQTTVPHYALHKCFLMPLVQYYPPEIHTVRKDEYIAF